MKFYDVRRITWLQNTLCPFLTSISLLGSAHGQFLETSLSSYKVTAIEEERILIVPPLDNLNYHSQVALDGTMGLLRHHASQNEPESRQLATLINVTSGVIVKTYHTTDQFTSSATTGGVAISQNHVLVGTTGELADESHRGFAYLFDRNSGAQLFRFIQTDQSLNRGDFGKSVAIHGTHALIGSDHDDTSGTRSGSAYLFDTNTGEQLFKFLPSDPQGNPLLGKSFGRTVTLNDDYAVIGAFRDPAGGGHSGAVYVYDLTTGEELQKLVASDPTPNALLGRSLALSGNLAAVGAFGAQTNGIRAGAVYIFDVSTGEQFHKLVAEDYLLGGRLGESVAIHGNYVLATSTNNDNGKNSGAAYLFDLTTGKQMAKFLASDGKRDDNLGEFGYAAALSDTHALTSNRFGRPYVFNVSDVITGNAQEATFNTLAIRFHAEAQTGYYQLLRSTNLIDWEDTGLRQWRSDPEAGFYIRQKQDAEFFYIAEE